MPDLILTPEQNRVANSLTSGSLFLQGPPGSGKTTTGVSYFKTLIKERHPLNTLLVMVPQRSLAAPYYAALADPNLPSGGYPTVVTIGGLAQRLIHLFWPAITANAGFHQPDLPPRFLTLETAQYFMAKIVNPLLQEGYFEQVVIDRNRLFSQIIDNLNKSAVIGFPYHEIGERLKQAWSGKPSQKLIYEQVQECANRFRNYCLEHNLLDYSLQIEVLSNHLANTQLIRNYLSNSFRHLIYDNIEEDVPIAHDFVRDWIPDLNSALLIYDEGSGYRAFLGSDPQTGISLKEVCSKVETFTSSYIMSPQVQQFQQSLERSLSHQLIESPSQDTCQAFRHTHKRFSSEMIDWVSEHVFELIHEEEIPAGEIAILTPYLSDTLRFSLEKRLEQAGVPTRSHRPSRSLQEEPATSCLLTLAKLAHPEWQLGVTPSAFRAMIYQTVEGIDLNRSDLITRILYHPQKAPEDLGDFDAVIDGSQERITFTFGNRFNVLREWLIQYREGESVELDVFLSKIFGEVLSQPRFGFHKDWNAADTAARIIESIQKFRRVVVNLDIQGGKEYIQMVEDGVISALYLENIREKSRDAVLIAPAHSFLMINRPVHIQFWLDIGSTGWSERLFQPLTHPYVLSRQWQSGRLWTDAEEYQTNQENLLRLTNGLLQRCSGRIILCATRVNEFGIEERGPLLRAIQSILRQFPPLEGDHDL